jgi:hypothetical protein
MLAPMTPLDHPAPPSLDPAGSPLPWLEWIMLPVTMAALAQLVALEIYAQLVLGRWPGAPGVGPFRPSGFPQSQATSQPQRKGTA